MLSAFEIYFIRFFCYVMVSGAVTLTVSLDFGDAKSWNCLWRPVVQF